MEDLHQLREIALQLRGLQLTSPTHKADLADWNAAARKFADALRLTLPIQVMHYLHDADIRIKDPEYRKAQDEMLNGIISDLERGNLPQSTGVTFSFHPLWLGVLALLLLAVMYWVVF